MTKSKARICYICYRIFPDTNFENYSRVVAENGYDVTVLTFLAEGQETYELQDRRKIVRIPLDQSPHTRKSRTIFALRAIQFLKRNQFSIIHINHTCNYFSLIKLLSKNTAKYIYHADSYPISSSRAKVLKMMIKNFVQCLLMEKVIIQSEELKERLLGIRNLKRSVVLPIGFNRATMCPITEQRKKLLRYSMGITQDQPVLVYCGIISKMRQLGNLVEALSKVRSVYSDAILMMVGTGNALDELRDMAVRLNLENNVIFTGRVPHEEVVNYIGMGDIGLSYVPINENFSYSPPLKTFEYMACGLPTIATKTVSNSRIIMNGANGLLVNDNAEDFARSIIDLLNDGEKMSLLKKNARESISEFDFEHITKTKLIPIYEKLLNPLHPG